MPLKAALEYKALELSRLAVEMTTDAGTGHPSTALSLAHVTAVLMYRVMRWNPADPWDMRADRLVLSEGHAVPIVYAACLDLAVAVGRSAGQSRRLRRDEVHDLRKADSLLDGHPNPALGFPFFDAATGSLGQGLSVAAGLALAARLTGSPRRVFCVCGDGEMREGQIAEAIDFVKDHHPGNLCLIVNSNRLAQSDYVSPEQSADVLQKKLRAAGWAVRRVDGHDVAALEAALSRFPKGKPLAVIAETVKGWHVAELQGLGHHGTALPPEEARHAIDVDLKLPDVRPTEDLTPPKPKGKKLAAWPALVPLDPPDFADKLKAGKLGTRKAYGLGLRDLGRKNSLVVALDADVKNSTFSEYFAAALPERFYECKIAEQNMISVASGLAAGGALPFANSFGKFLVRGYDQLEMAAIGGLNLKLAGSHSGVTLAADGPSQMALLDLPVLRALSHTRLADGRPMAVMLLPADAVCAYKCVELAARHFGPVYIRTLRPELPLLYPPGETFQIGGAKVLRDGADFFIAGCCYTVHLALAAAEKLSAEGISAGVLDCYSLPLEDERVTALAQNPAKKILALDDSYVGGIGSELSEISAAARGARVVTMWVKETPKSAREPDEVLRQTGLGLDAVVAQAREVARA